MGKKDKTRPTSGSSVRSSASKKSHKKEEAKHADSVEEAPPEPSPLPEDTGSATVWKKLPSVWNVSNPFRQRQLFVQLFGLPDTHGVSVSREAITVDFFFYGLLFAHETGFNRTQTRIFYGILTDLKTQLEQKGCTLQQCFGDFKDKLLAHVVEAGAEDAATVDVDVEEERASRERERQEELRRQEEASSKKKHKAKPKHKGKQAQEEEKDEEPQPAATAWPRPLRVFAHVHVQAVSEYITNSVFRHFELYRAVFGPEFTPTQLPITYDLQLQTVVPHFNALDSAIDVKDSLDLLEEKRADDERSAPSTAQAVSDIPSTAEQNTGALLSTAEDHVKNQANVEEETPATTEMKTDVPSSLDAVKADLEQRLQSNYAALQSRLERLEREIRQGS